MNMRKLIGNPFGNVLCVVLAISMATGPSAEVWGQAPARALAEAERAASDTTLVAAPEAGKIDLKYVTPSAVALLALHPRSLLTSPAIQLTPVEVVSAAGLQQLGFDPANVDELVAFAEPPLGVTVPYGLVLKFSKPFSIEQIPMRLLAHVQVGNLDGKEYLQSGHPNLPSLYMPNDRTLLVMPDATLRRVLSPAADAPESSLRARVAELSTGDDLYAVVDVAALRPIIVPWMNFAVMRQGAAFPEEAKPFLEVPNLVATIDLSFNITNDSPTLLAIHANDAKSADRLEELYNLAEQIQRKNALANAAKLQESDDPIMHAMGKYVERMANTPQETYKYERRAENLILLEANFSSQSQQSKLILVAVCGMLVALLLPAIQAAREAARRNQSMSNLKALVWAMHSYSDDQEDVSLPPHASYSTDGKPLLSWRVHILPYLKQDELFKRFKLDEPWDSEHNRALIPLMPEVFNNPNVNEMGKTNYLAIVGKECVMDGTPKGMRFHKISDGTSNTIVLVEADANQAVEWTKPEDIEFNPESPKAGVGNLRSDWFNVAWADGHVSFVANGIDPSVLRSFVTRSGGEVVPND